jgi:hypothetical protein
VSPNFTQKKNGFTEMRVYWDMTPCRLVSDYRQFEGS